MVRNLLAGERLLTAILGFLVVMMFVVLPLSRGGLLQVLSRATLTVLLVAGLVAFSRRRGRLAGAGALVVVAVTLDWLQLEVPGPTLAVAGGMFTVVAILALTVLLLVSVLRDGEVTFHRISGAVAVYLLLALLFAITFGVVNATVSNAFSVSGGAALEGGWGGFTYFSLVTLTTVGYGDIAAVHPIARSLAALEALVGQLFPVILIARLVSLEVASRQR